MVIDCNVTRVTNAIDGDSFEADVIQNDETYKDVGIRVHGIDCPEMRGKCDYERKLARKAAKFTADMLEKSEVIGLNVVDVDAYDRLLCDVICDGESLASALIDAGLAKSYEGSKRNWC